jgi:hypothetical protein
VSWSRFPFLTLSVYVQYRDSAEEMYEAQRQARLRERKAEIEEYRRSYFMGE